MKKIGLLTYHNTNNFGATLQAYALSQKLNDLGYSCEIINYPCPNIVRREKPHFPRLRKNLFKYIYSIFYGPMGKYYSLAVFLRRNARVGSLCDRDKLSKVAQKYDVLLIGSDMVWEMDINGNDYTYFLDFEQDSSKKIAFGASVGFPWREEHLQKIKPLIKEFRHIAVREDLSAEQVENATGVRPPVVCDPTMLLTREEWMRHTSQSNNKDKYVLVYFENDKNECMSFALKYAKMNGLRVKSIDLGSPDNLCTQIYPRSIKEFLSLILNAELVVTASYHGILFSLYFHKRFVYFLRRQTSRVDTIAKRLEISSINGECLKDGNVPDLNYDEIDARIDDYRTYSLSVLQGFLSE